MPGPTNKHSCFSGAKPCAKNQKKSLPPTSSKTNTLQELTNLNCRRECVPQGRWLTSAQVAQRRKFSCERMPKLVCIFKPEGYHPGSHFQYMLGRGTTRMYLLSHVVEPVSTQLLEEGKPSTQHHFPFVERTIHTLF